MVILLIAFLIISLVILSDCQEQKTTEKLVIAPLNTLSLTVDYLTEGFSEIYNESPPLNSIEFVFFIPFFLKYNSDMYNILTDNF